MNFAFTEEQEELRTTIRAFLEAKSPESAVREQMETEAGYDQAVWSQMAEQMGLQGLHIPEEYGGSGFGYVELGIVLEEMGRALLCAPFFSSVVLAANTLIQSGDDDAKKAHLPGIASGETIAALAFTEPSGKWDEAGHHDGGHAVGRRLHPVGHEELRDRRPHGQPDHRRRPHAPVASACSPSTATRPGSPRRRCRRWTRPASRPSSSSTTRPPRCIGEEGKGWDVLSTVLDLAAVGLAAEQVGGAQFVLEMAVQYAKDRVQFGRPIGSFQAIKHKCADMLLEVESAKSAAYYGLWCAAEMNDELPSVASLAKAYCSEAYFHATAENIQIHGGIGFTWEHPAHLYFKRAKSSRAAVRRPDVPPRTARPAHRYLVSRSWTRPSWVFAAIAAVRRVRDRGRNDRPRSAPARRRWRHVRCTNSTRRSTSSPIGFRRRARRGSRRPRSRRCSSLTCAGCTRRACSPV